jgi:hypothetical protein
MYFQHSVDIWRDFPALVPGVLYADGITSHAEVEARVDTFAAVAKARLADGPEGELPEIQAWRRAFTQMGLKPTQYRCASESLLRRFRKDPGRRDRRRLVRTAPVRGADPRRAPLHVRNVSPVTPGTRAALYPRDASGRDPVRVSCACSASWIGFGWPARPR